MVEISCQGLLFDLDGVLIDSTPAVTRVWKQWAIAHGFDPEEVVHRAHGRPSLSTIREYLPQSDHEAENKILEQCEMDDLDGVVPLPGALELLASLPPRSWTVVTSCTRPLAQVRLRAAGLPTPPTLVTSSDVARGKPDPEPYLKGASALGFDSATCVVFEDAPAGIRSGKAAGCRVVAFRTTLPESSLREAGADWIVDDPSAVRLLAGDQTELRLTFKT